METHTKHTDTLLQNPQFFILLICILRFFFIFQGYEGSLLKVTSKNGKTSSVSTNSTVFENHRKSLIASEASYVYILSGQKFIKNAKNG